MTAPAPSVAAGQAAVPTVNLEHALLELAVGLVDPSSASLDATLERALRAVGEQHGVARTYLCTCDGDAATLAIREWCAPGVAPLRAGLREVPIQDLPAWTDVYRSGEVVERGDATDPVLEHGERDGWASQGITAALAFPLHGEERCLGYVGFDAVDGPRSWSDRDREVLALLAQLLTRMHERRELQQLRHTNADLAVANQQLADFAGGVAHDLKAPLASVQGMLELLGSGRVSGADQEQVLERALLATTRMTRMIDQLLAYAAAGQEIGTRVPVDLDVVLAAARDNLAPQIATRQARISVDALPTVLGDELRLVEVFQNLLCNALRHGPADRQPTVRVHGERSGDTVVVRVGDDGPGIPEAERSRVLRSFERGTDVQVPGSGLGLPLCVRIVEAHDGSLELGTSPLGGLEVTVRLPAPPAAAGADDAVA